MDLVTPVFKSPPRIVGVSRTIRHRPDGQAIVAVAFRGRSWSAVISDLIEGVVFVNELTGAAASRARDDLWLELESSAEAAA